MARIKNPPRLAQPDPEPSFTQKPLQLKTPISDIKPLASKPVSKDIDKSSIDNRVRSKLSIATEAEESLNTTEERIAEQTSEAEHGFVVNSPSNKNDLICPQCDSKLSDIGIKEFREHVESCTRRTIGDSESTASSLSPPPEYMNADDDADADDEEDYLKPYEKNGMTWYPESHVDAVADDAVEGVDGQQKIPLRKITDPSKFVDSLEDFDDMSYQELYSRCHAAQQALVVWQNEFIDIDQYIRVTEPAAPGKEHKNPRMPKPHLTGVGYQDQLEAYAYGYEYNSHHSAVGNQNPLKQRITNAGSGGRELRQRVPTQKAAEADQSTTPDSEEGANGRRRGRAQKLRDQLVDGDLPSGQGSRGRNTSRFNSESRGQTPQKTFPSGKTIGRPRTKGTKFVAGSRLKEIQLEHDGSQNESTPEPAQAENGGFAAAHANLAQPEHGLKQSVQTTEHWGDETEQEDVLLRPSTSDSTATSNSTDDMRMQPVRASTRNRKRANTSDFEDALPASKRFGRKPGNAQTNGQGRAGAANPNIDGNGAGGNTGKRRARLEENNGVEWFAGADEPKQKRQRLKAKKSSEDMRATSSMAAGVGPSTAADSSSTNAGTMDANLDTIKKTGKDGSKPSRASLNMMRRWAAKKKAEALGLPVPKIGRYPKGGSVSSTSNVVAAPDLNDSSNNVGGRKRKRDDFEASSADTGDAVTSVIGGITKGRGGRPKKVTNEEVASSTNPAEQENDVEGNVLGAARLDNKQGQGDSLSAAQAPKRKGGRPKKNLAPVQPETQADIETEVQPEISLEYQAGTNGDAIAAEYGQEGPIEEIVPLPTKSKGGRPRKAAVTAPILSEETQPINGEKEVEDSSQPLAPRTSGRIRRQTSAAASSQADTRPSSRSSKATVTPAPLLMSAPASVQQSPVEPVIKQEPLTGPILPKMKRGRQPKSTTTKSVAESSHIPAQDTEGILEPPTKRRRVARGTNSASAENTPVPVTFSGYAQNRHESMGRTEDAEVSSAVAEAAEAAQNLALDGQPGKKIRAGWRPRKGLVVNIPGMDHVADARSTMETTAAEANASEDHLDSSSDVPASNTRRGKGLRKQPTRRAVAEDVSSDGHSTPEIISGPANVSESAKDISIDVEPKKKRGGYRARKAAAADSATEDVESEIDPKQEVSPTKRRRPGRPAKRTRGAESGNKADANEATGEASTRRARVLEHGESDESEESAGGPPMTRASRRGRAGSTQAASLVPVETVQEQSPKSRIVRLKTYSRSTSDAIAAITGQPAQPTVPEPKGKGTWGGKRTKGISASNDGPDTMTITEPNRIAGIPGRETGLRPNHSSVDDMHAASEPSRKATIGRARGKRLASDMGGQSSMGALDLPDPAPKTPGIEATGSRKGRGGKRPEEKAGKNIDGDGSEKGDDTKVEEVAAAPEMDAAAKKKEAARLSKAEKMRESMKRRWASGAMDAVMAKKKADNLARKAALARAAEETATTESGPASAPAKRKAAPTREAAKPSKRRRTMNATMDGAADEFDYDVDIASPVSSPTRSRKMSEYERFQELASPLRSTHSKRQRRPAALRASQSFGKFTDSNDEDEDREDDDEEDVESEINKQFESEYGHFQALASPAEIPGVLVGKRKRKPVINLEEAMRIEAGDDDDDEFQD